MAFGVSVASLRLLSALPIAACFVNSLGCVGCSDLQLSTFPEGSAAQFVAILAF